MARTIWFVDKDAAPIEEFGAHLRTVKQAQYFQNLGYNVKIICSSAVHNSDIDHLDNNKDNYVEEIRDNVPFIFVRTNKPKCGTLKRLLSYVIFSKRVSKLVKHINTPDIIIHASRIPFDYYVYPFAKRIHAKYIIDVTDFWPMEFERMGYLSSGNPILKLFYKIERYLYSVADHVVFSLEGYKDYIREKGWDKGSGGPIDLDKTHYINNGIDISEIHKNICENIHKDEELDDKTLFKVVYLGSIRPANNLIQLVNAAKLLLNEKSIVFLIYGDGADRAVLEEKCRVEGITNVHFKDKWVLPKFVPSILSRADLNILNYGKGWAPYGGSMNKMFMAFACGKPVVCNAGMGYSPIRDHNLGFDVAFDSPKAYAESIIYMYKLPKNELEAMSARCKSVAMDYDTNILNQKFKKYCQL